MADAPRGKPKAAATEAPPAEIWTVPGAVMTLAGGEQRLRGGKCSGCAAEFFPKQPVCLECWSEEIATTVAGGMGESWSSLKVVICGSNFCAGESC